MQYLSKELLAPSQPTSDRTYSIQAEKNLSISPSFQPISIKSFILTVDLFILSSGVEGDQPLPRTRAAPSTGLRPVHQDVLAVVPGV